MPAVENQLPTFDELMAKPPADGALPTFDEFVAKTPEAKEEPGFFSSMLKSTPSFNFTPIDSEAQKQFLKGNPVGRIMSATGHGISEGFGDDQLGLSDQSRQDFARLGILPDYEKGQTDMLRAFNESIIAPTAATLDFGMRAAGAAIYGIEEAAAQTGEELGMPRVGKGVAELIEFGAQGAPGMNVFATSVKRIPRVIEEGNRARVFDGEAVYSGLKEPTAKQEAARIPESVPEAPAPKPEVSPPPPDIHTLARQHAPEAFLEYDSLVTRRDSYLKWWDELREQRKQEATANAPHNAEIAELQAKIEEANPRKKKIYQERIEALEDKNADYVAEQTHPLNATGDVKQVRKELADITKRLGELSPDVRDAYREAEKKMPEVEKTEAAPVVTEPEVKPVAQEVIPETVSEPAMKAPETQAVVEGIAKDVTDKLTAAGRPVEEAGAAAQLVASHYETRSKRFDGKLGTADEMYKRDGANIRTGKGESAQSTGKIRRATANAKATITLMKSADASTFIHETGHHWLDELVGDAKHALASEGLKRDADTVHKWLGVKEGDKITVKQHEKFARGFERYMMEGTAPSKELAGVFAQFKEWLTRIYRVVENLKSPITADIRAVFDRLIVESPEPVIAAEREAMAPEVSHSGVDIPVSGAVKEADASFERPEAKSQTAEEVAKPEKAAPVTAPNQVMPKAESTLVDKAGNIRVENLGTPEDVNAVIRQVAEQNEGFVTARRGVISDNQVLDLADALGMDAKTLDRRKLGEAFNAEEVVAARKLLIRSATDLRDLMGKAATGSDADVLAYAEAKARHVMIQEQVSGVTAEAGRALRAFHKLEGMKEAELLGDFLRENTGQDLYQLRREAKRGAELDTPEKLSKFINDSQKPTYSQMAIEYWINALLSGPVTHVKNVIGNSIVALNAVGETALAAGIGKVLNSKEKVALGEIKGRWFGLTQGSVEGLKTAAAVIRSEENITGAHQVEGARRTAIPGKLGKVIRIPTRLLSAEDEVFKAIGYRQELNAQAYRTAAKEGLEGQALIDRVADIVRNPSEEVMKAAKKNAAYQTFTNPLGPLGRAVQTLSNAHPVAKFIIPFVRTPVNILKYAGERTPLGLLSEGIRDNLTGKNGTIARDTQLARLAMGSTMGLAAFSLATQGLMTGGGPSDPAQKAFLRTTGWQPYSVKIGESYYSYQWLDPFSTIMGSCADLAETIQEESSDETGAKKESLAAMVLGSISQNVLSKLSLRGVSDVMQAMTDPDRYGEKYIQNFTSGFVPNAFKQVATAIDPVQRETRTVLDAFKSKLPGIREGLLPKRDVWGEPIVSGGALGPDIVSPVYQSRLTGDPVNQILLKAHFYPSRPERKIRGVELTDQQYDDYTRVAGRLTKMRLNALVQVPGFDQVPVSRQVDVISKIVNSSRESARGYTMMQNPDIIQKAVEAKIIAAGGKPTSQSAP